MQVPKSDMLKKSHSSLREALEDAFHESESSAKKLHEHLTCENCFDDADSSHTGTSDLEDLMGDKYTHDNACGDGVHHVKHFHGKTAANAVTGFNPEDRDYMNEKGWVHSVETLGSLEGPGNRFLVFLNGCKARCLYCENPDTWELRKGATEMTVSHLIDQCAHYSSYYEHGGVTVSGGDPMVQHKFCSSLLFAIHKHLGLHTCVETTGQTPRTAWDAVLPHTDLVLLCIKGTSKETYRKITKTVQIGRMLEFIDEIEKREIEWWCRYVVVPGFTDTKEEIDGLIEICKRSKTMTRVEFLPYHTLGKHKWASLGLSYPLEGVPSPSKAEVLEIAQRMRQALHEVRPEIVVTSGLE